MIGKSTIVWAVLATVASGILYHTSYRVQQEREHLAGIERQIAREQQSIQVLHAEWAYLTEPSQLQRMVDGHTALRATRTNQLTTLAALPRKPQAPAPDSVAPQAAPEMAPPALVASAQPAPTRAVRLASLIDTPAPGRKTAQVLPAQYATATYGAAR